MSREPFIVAPSRKPKFWAAVDRLNRAENRASKKVKPEPTPEPKKKGGRK